MLWRDLQPLLLKSAGVVGLAGMIVAVISNASEPVKSGDSVYRAAPQAASEAPSQGSNPAIAALAPSKVEVTAAAENPIPPPAAAGFAADPAPPPAAEVSAVEPIPPPIVEAAPAAQVLEPAAINPTSPQAIEAAPEPAPADPIPPVSEESAAAVAKARVKAIAKLQAAEDAPRIVASLPSPTISSPQALAVEPAPQLQPEPAEQLPPNEAAIPADASAGAAIEEFAVWADEAVNCPRDWVAVEGSEAAGDAADCGPGIPAAPPPVTAPAEEGSFQSAALNLAPAAGLEIAPSGAVVDGLSPDYVARIPLPRPDPPPQPKRTVRKASAKWPAGPPPNCGSKHAYWRYVNKTPTWYCK